MAEKVATKSAFKPVESVSRQIREKKTHYFLDMNAEAHSL